MLRKLSIGFVALSALGLGLWLPGAAVAQKSTPPDQTFAVSNDQKNVGPGQKFNVSADCTDPNQGGQANSYATGGGCEFVKTDFSVVLNSFYAGFPFFKSFPVIAGWRCIGTSQAFSGGTGQGGTGIGGTGIGGSGGTGRGGTGIGGSGIGGAGVSGGVQGTMRAWAVCQKKHRD
jgi:hypothetical protein